MRFTILTFYLLFTLQTLSAQTLVVKNELVFDAHGMLFTGEFFQVDAHGNRLTKMNFFEGKLSGELVYFYSNGNIREVGHYTNGVKHGLWETYNVDGSKTGEALFYLGLKDGIWTIWDDQGNRRYHMVYSQDKQIESWKIWDDENNLVSERLFN